MGSGWISPTIGTTVVSELHVTCLIVGITEDYVATLQVYTPWLCLMKEGALVEHQMSTLGHASY